MRLESERERESTKQLNGEFAYEIIARTKAADVSILPRRLSPILTETICAPGATPLSSG